MKPINYLVLSDIHLGHNINTTDNIIKNLKQYFDDNHKVFKHLDIIFIAGDIFDKLLVNGSKSFLEAIEWLTMLSMYCLKNNIKLRILEGTPSHDWKQASVLNSMLKEININVDFKYIDTLAIENMNDLDLTILYVPDEYKHDANDTYQDVLKLLEENKLTQVDIAIMHGQFHYQLPMVMLESSHTESNYLDIVKYYINIGHIHTHSSNGRILAQGSFDRLTHGEEEAKGGILVTLDKEHDDIEYRFIENKHAMLFKTIDYREITDQEILKNIDKDIIKYPMGTNIRIMVSKDSDFNKSIKDIKHKYPAYNIKVETKGDKNKSLNEEELLDIPTIDSFQINSSNIEELLMDELKKHLLTPLEVNIAKTELSSVLAQC